MFREKRLIARLVFGVAIGAAALPSRVWSLETVLPGAELRGEATLRYLGLPVYEAQLFTPSGRPLDWNDDFALQLTYLRAFSQGDLVEATLREFTRLGGALPLEKPLADCFLGVSRGDRYLAVTDGPDRIRFWRNGQQTCTLSYPRIKLRFMSIFLGDNTQSQGFTRALRSE